MKSKMTTIILYIQIITNHYIIGYIIYNHRITCTLLYTQLLEKQKRQYPYVAYTYLVLRGLISIRHNITCLRLQKVLGEAINMGILLCIWLQTTIFFSV